jgi:hypothetical protein
MLNCDGVCKSAKSDSEDALEDYSYVMMSVMRTANSINAYYSGSS